MNRAFVIGNGPSLNRHDLTKLKDEVTFGCNSIYMNYDKMGFAVNNYFQIDCLVLKQCINTKEFNDYINLPEVKLFFVNKICINHYKRVKFKNENKKMVMNTTSFGSANHKVVRISPMKSLPGYVCTGPVMIDNAIKLNYNPIYLIGMDMEYHSWDDEDKLTSLDDDGIKYMLKDNDDDIDHFCKDYWKSEEFIRYELPGDDILEPFERLNKLYSDSHIYNATIGGKGDMFERVSYNDLF